MVVESIDVGISSKCRRNEEVELDPFFPSTLMLAIPSSTSVPGYTTTLLLPPLVSLGAAKAGSTTYGVQLHLVQLFPPLLLYSFTQLHRRPPSVPSPLPRSLPATLVSSRGGFQDPKIFLERRAGYFRRRRSISLRPLGTASFSSFVSRSGSRCVHRTENAVLQDNKLEIIRIFGDIILHPFASLC